MWYIVSWVNFLQSDVNVFHLTSHYLVKLEKLIAHVLPLSCYRKKLQNLSHLNCVLQICQIWIQLITACGKYCKRRCAKHASLIWSYQRRDGWRRRRMVAAMMQLARVLSRCINSFRSVMSVFFNFSCNTPTRCNQLDSNLANLGPQLRWNKFWSFFL